MKEKRILLAEDDDTTREIMKEMLVSAGYDVTDCPDGKTALDAFRTNTFPVVITDIDMPVMDGNELIRQLNAFEIPPVILVITVRKDPGTIIDIMKKGVYDYILKPVDMANLNMQINRAFESYNLKRAFEIGQREKVIRLENALEWYKLEERIINRDIKSIGANVFESLLTSFNQGTGIGALVTLASIMKSNAIKEGNYYKIEDELFNIIINNAAAAKKAIQTLGNMTEMISANYESEKVSLALLHDKISNKITELDSQIAIRKHHMILSDKQDFFSEIFIEINLNHFLNAVEEIILNSLKFSPAGSNVVVLVMKQHETCSISVINDIASTEKGFNGIPIGHENLVFEPFYRLAKTVYEDYDTLDYGLGLTLVEKIVKKYGGSVSISNINDYSDMKSGLKTKVECSIVFKTV